MHFGVFTKFSYSISLFFFLCGHKGPPIGENAVGLLYKSSVDRQLLRQISHKVSYTRCQTLFYLWWMECIVKLSKIPSNYSKDCRYEKREIGEIRMILGKQDLQQLISLHQIVKKWEKENEKLSAVSVDFMKTVWIHHRRPLCWDMGLTRGLRYGFVWYSR